MRSKKQLLVILFMVMFVFFVQCSKVMEKSPTDDVSEHNKKNPLMNTNHWSVRARRSFVLTLLVTKIFGVVCYISTRPSPGLIIVASVRV